MAPRTLLNLVRHGETSANVEGVWHGSTDTALTERGRAQTLRVARHLAGSIPRPVALYASPLQRAWDTALAIGEALGLEVREEPGLSEYHLGSWEGKSYLELIQTHAFFERIRRDPDYAPEGAETPRQVAERCADALRRIAAAHPAEGVAVVSHGGALTLALGLLLDGDPSTWRRVMDNCAVTQLCLSEDPELLDFNRVSHLEDLR